MIAHVCYICDTPIQQEPIVWNALGQDYAYPRHQLTCAPGTANWALVYPESLMSVQYGGQEGTAA